MTRAANPELNTVYETENHRLLEKVRQQVVGLNIRYPVISGESTRRIYLDSTATTLRLKIVQDVMDAFQPHYANTHSSLHYAARISTREYLWAHDMVLRFLGADPAEWMCFFVGSGATAAINRIAQTLRRARPDRDAVITSVMEHHSNDLPHRAHFDEVVHVSLEATASSLGGLDMVQLENELGKRRGRVNYVAVTGVSNVTGIVNPVREIAKMAHRHDALVVVDAAQMIAHVPIRMSDNADRDMDLDVLAFSGHKIYAPGSPGVVVARRSLFSGVEPTEVGGGMVDKVALDRYSASDRFPDREEAGTPNIPGAIGLAAALYVLDKIGMETIEDEESEVLEYALQRLAEIRGLVIYGETDPTVCRRAGAISFNLDGFNHALTAAILNDYFNIAVRNECFCAHPYVREMVMFSLEEAADRISNEELERLADLQRGMVRASFGIYNTKDDVDALIGALRQMAGHQNEFESLYTRLPNGDYRHSQFDVDVSDFFSVEKSIDSCCST
ncbi:MAG: aminotransferase class V-fold PLP-dependent enzyme [Terriglobia bacterium]